MPRFLATAKLLSQSLLDLGEALKVLELLAREEDVATAPPARNALPSAGELPPCKVIYLLPKCGDLMCGDLMCGDLIEVLVPV